MTETCYCCHKPRDLADLLRVTNARTSETRYCCRPTLAARSRGVCFQRATVEGSWRLALAAVPEPPPLPADPDPEPLVADLFDGRPVELSSRFGWQEVPDDA